MTDIAEKSNEAIQAAKQKPINMEGRQLKRDRRPISRERRGGYTPSPQQEPKQEATPAPVLQNVADVFISVQQTLKEAEDKAKDEKTATKEFLDALQQNHKTADKEAKEVLKRTNKGKGNKKRQPPTFPFVAPLDEERGKRKYVNWQMRNMHVLKHLEIGGTEQAVFRFIYDEYNSQAGTSGNYEKPARLSYDEIAYFVGVTKATAIKRVEHLLGKNVIAMSTPGGKGKANYWVNNALLNRIIGDLGLS